MKWTMLTLVLLTCGCAAVSKAELLIGKVSAKVDELGPAVTAAADAAKAAQAGVAMVKAEAEAKIESAFAELEAKGAPTGSKAELWAWAKDNPVEAGGSLGSLGVVFAAMLAGYKRKSKALTAVVKAVDDLPDEMRAAAKSAVVAHGGRDKAIDAAIREAKA